MALVQCPECGSTVSDRATSCPKCGTPLAPQATPSSQIPVQGFTQQVYSNVPTRPALTPEQEEYVDKFHWGPFTFTWIWALCNNLVLYGLIGLVACIFTSGFAQLILWFVFGFKGNRWAWEKSKASTFDDFESTQDEWDKWGKLLFIVSIIIAVIAIMIMFAAM